LILLRKSRIGNEKRATDLPTSPCNSVLETWTHADFRVVIGFGECLGDYAPFENSIDPSRILACFDYVFRDASDEKAVPRMGNNHSKRDIYAVKGRSLAQRMVLSTAIGSCVGLAWWLLTGGGIGSLDTWFGWAWRSGDEARRLCLAVALSVYFVRLIFTTSPLHIGHSKMNSAYSL
jgi:hypothetical protein